MLATRSDKIISEKDSLALARAIPGAELLWYDGSHGAPLKKPEVVTQPMLAFYKRINAGSR